MISILRITFMAGFNVKISNIYMKQFCETYNLNELDQETCTF